MNIKNIKTKIILSATVLLSIVGFVGTANAAGVSLNVSPASITKTAGATFSASVGLTNATTKVYAVEGTLVFNGLTCQSINLASDVLTQSLPTCSNPHFLVGIPNGITSDKVLLTISVTAGNVGAGSISLSGVDIIGEGVSVGSASISGNYTIVAVPTPTPNPNPTPTPTPTPTPNPQVTQPVAQQEIPAPTQEVTTDNNIPANTQAAALATAGSGWANILWVLLVLAIIGGVVYLVYHLKGKKK